MERFEKIEMLLDNLKYKYDYTSSSSDFDAEITGSFSQIEDRLNWLLNDFDADGNRKNQ